MKRLFSPLLVAALALWPACLGAVQPATVVNPSFEADTFTIFPGYVDANGPITGWEVPGGAGINPADGSPFADNGVIPDGTQVAFIQSEVALSQMISGLVVGESYEVRYFENARNCCGGTFPSLRVTMGGETIVAEHIVNPVGGSNPYVEVISDAFVATAESMELAFIKSNAPDTDNTVLIDNVSVAPPAGPVLVEIPGLYNTGVDDAGVPLADGAVDPHYVLIQNPDGGSPDAIVQDSTAFPIVDGPWLANSDLSKWIGPQFNTVASVDDTYVYRLTFDLAGVDLETVVITGGWATDNTGVNIQVNGTDTGETNPNGFGGLTPFTLDRDNATFVEGENTIDFVVNNAPPPGYTGLRVENLEGTASLPGTPAFIVSQPEGGLGGTGKSFTFSAQAQGSSPISYQWQKDGEEIPGAEEPTLTLTDLTLEDAGTYTVVASNPFGSETSDPAILEVRPSISTVYNTGVDDSGLALPDGSVDPHYILLVNPDTASPEAIVQDGSVFPISDGTWVVNNERSKWIGPQFNTVASAGGEYVYRHAFDLTGFESDSVVILGEWTSDNTGVQIRLNGADTGITNPGNFNTLNPFSIESGFTAGINTLDFVVNNASAGFTGLRVDNLVAVGNPLPDETAPFIITQPSDVEAVVTETVTFTVAANGSPPLSYQWFFGLDPIPGATDASLTFTIDFPDVAGEYSVEVSNDFGSVRSDPATLTILGAPRILTQPQDQTVAAGDTVSFMVEAIGEPPLSYQWLFEGEEIPGATDPTLTIPGVFPEDEGAYSVRVSNFSDSTTSREALLTVLSLVPGLYNTGVDNDGNVLPDGAVDPHYTLIVNPDGGSSDAFVQDSGLFPIVDGPWLANSDTSKWIGPRVQTDAAIADGDYTYRLTFNLAGFNPDTVIITGEWAIDNTGLDIVVNGVSTGQANTGGFAALNPFRIDSGLVAGQNTIDFIVNNAPPPGPTGLRVANLRGIGATVEGVPPTILTQPEGRTVDPGDTVTLMVSVDGSQPLSYQWFLGPDSIPGATEPSYSFVAEFLDQAGSYSVEVSNPFGSIRSEAATIEIVGEPRITRQPQSTVVEAGTDAIFSVEVIGVLPLEYQWRFNGEEIAGATEPSLTVAGVSPEDVGTYSVHVSNPAGEVTSNPATLGIGVPVGGLFNTGVNDDGAPLDDGAVDSHYEILVNPDSAESSTAFVQDSTVFPIVDGPWLANSDASKWIGPRVETSQAAPGNYTYRLTFDLAGFDPSQVVVTGMWAADDGGGDVFINGTATGHPDLSSFVAFTPFEIHSGFVEGLNTLDFTFNNGAVGYTGLRVENLRALAVPLPNDPPAVALTRPTDGAILLAGTTVTLAAEASDPDGEVASVEFFAAGIGSLGIDSEAPYEIEIPNAPAGTFVLTAVATDNRGATTESEPVTVMVVENAPPQAVDDNYATDENTPLEVAPPGVLANDEDADGDALSARLVDGPSAGSLTFNSDGSFRYVPNPNFFGEDEFSYVANDGLEDSVPAIVRITVRQVNLPPDCQALVEPLVDLGNESPYPTVIAGDGIVAQVLLDATASSDPEGDPLSFAWFIHGEPTPFSTDPVALVALEPGLNEITLVVSDGEDSCTETLLIDVLTPGGAIEELILLVDDATLVGRKTKQPYLATLKNAVAAYDRGSFGAGANKLKAFMNKVRAQLSKNHPELAGEWIRIANEIIDATQPPAEE